MHLHKEGHQKSRTRNSSTTGPWVRRKAADATAKKEDGKQLPEIMTAEFMPGQRLQGEVVARQTYEGH